METSIYDEYNKSLYKNSGQAQSATTSGPNVLNDPSTLSSDNIIEFGQFRRLSVSGVMLTVSKGDDIQKAINKVKESGGGTVLLAVGTYLLNQDIVIPNDVNLQGASRDNVILDCNADYKVSIMGTDVYTTGTITINDGDDEVVGSGTTFTSAMVGRSIFLGKNGDFLWYPITAFTDTTHITIGSPYTGTNLSGDTYTIATPNSNSGITTLTIQNATGAGLKCQYAMEPFFDNVYVVGCGTGLDFDQVIFPLMFLSTAGNGVNWNANEVSGYEVRFSTFDDSTSGASIIMTSTGNATFYDASVRGNFGDGINMTNCWGNTFISVDVSDNGGQGIEMVSGCQNNQFVSVANNANVSDGVKLTATADANMFSNCQFKNNGGYGLNVAASTCDDNVIVGNIFSGNSTAAYSDSGTNTVIRSNSGTNDNGGNYTLQFSSSTNTVADSTTYYFGSNFFVVMDTAGTLNKIRIPRAGTVTACYFEVRNRGTLSTSETSTLSLRLNNTTDTTVSSAVTTSSNYTSYSNTALSIAVTENDYFEIKWATPAFSTNPTIIDIFGTIYIE